MKRAFLAFAAALFMAAPAHAQVVTAVTACGSMSPLPSQPAGLYGSLVVDVNGTLCTTGSSFSQKTVAQLATLGCASANKGQIFIATDAASPTWNATLSGGGGVTVLAFCNGSNWTAH